MPDLILQKIDRKTLDQARNLYFGDMEISQICFSLSIEPETLRFYVYGPDNSGDTPTCWHSIKKKLQPTVISQYIKSKINVLEMTAGMGLEILNMSLVTLRDTVKAGEQILSVDEMSKLAKIVVEMDKLVRLESGLATETINHIGLSRAEAKELLANDPFAQSIEAEYSELPWLCEEKK